MATTGRLDLKVWRNDDVYEMPLRVRGLDLSNLDLRAQIRPAPDSPSLLADLGKVTNGNAEGLRLAGVSVVDGVPVSDLRIRLNKSTRQAFPYMGEVGDPAVLAWALQIAGRTRIVGDVIVLAHAFGSDTAPAMRPAGFASGSRGYPQGAATLTISGEDVIALAIDGVDIAVDASDRAVEAMTAAELASATATAAARYFESKAAGEASSATGQLFSTDDGAGNVIYYRRTAGGSVEIGRALTPAALAADGGASLVGFRAAGAGAVRLSAQDAIRDRGISVIDFGAVGDGVTDDGVAIYNALLAVQTVAGGVVVGAELIFPYRPLGYKIGRKLIAAAGVRIRVLGKGQRFFKSFDGDLWEVQNNAIIEGGDWIGGGYTGHAFVFPSGFGKQQLIGVKADTGWVDEVVYMPLDGGSQSIAANCVLTAGPGKYAYKVADGFLNTAAPRTVTGLQTNGALGVDFGGCNDFFLSDSFVGGLRFTGDSRGVHAHGVRVANQATLEIRGFNHVLALACNPIPTIMPGTDSVSLNGYFNSGPPIDNSGNSRNSITYQRAEYGPAENFPILRQGGALVTWPAYTASPDNRGSRPRGGRARAGATYTFDFFFPITTSTSGIGSGILSIDLPIGCATYNITDQYVPVMVGISVDGPITYKQITGRIFTQSAGQGSTMRLYDQDGVPFTSASTMLADGKTLSFISGTVQYTA